MTTVSDFYYDQFPLTCDQGGYNVSGEFQVESMKVNRKRRFKGVWDPPGWDRIKVSGRFSKSWKSARGRLSVRLDIGGSWTNCYTGRQSWKAAR